MISYLITVRTYITVGARVVEQIKYHMQTILKCKIKLVCFKYFTTMKIAGGQL